MKLGDEEVDKVVNFVKQEPRTVQEVSKLINKSWVTTDSYLKQIKEKTGLISIKTFRKGSQGAVKIVFYNHSDSMIADDLKKSLYEMILKGRQKTDFDVLEIFQFVPNESKKAFLEQYQDENVSQKQNLISLFRQANDKVYCFSGNLSFINIKENGISLLDIIEETVTRKVMVKILCRVNLASVSNLNKLKKIITQYPKMIEIKHAYQPLRGFIFDDKLARLMNEEQLKLYKQGELERNTRIFYEIYDTEWVSWLQKVFWNIFRTSIGANERLREIEKLF